MVKGGKERKSEKKKKKNRMGSYTILTPPPPYFPLHISPLLLAQQALWYFLVLIAVLVTKLSCHKKV